MNPYSSLAHTKKDKAADLLANTSLNLDIIYHLTNPSLGFLITASLTNH